jgi:putative transcriptional regulator
MSARTFPGRLAAALTAAGKTQGWLAGELGRSEGTVSHWCSGRSRPGWEEVEKIARLLGVEPGPLVFGVRRVRRASTGEQPAARRAPDTDRPSWTGTEG